MLLSSFPDLNPYIALEVDIPHYSMLGLIRGTKGLKSLRLGASKFKIKKMLIKFQSEKHNISDNNRTTTTTTTTKKTTKNNKQKS